MLTEAGTDPKVTKALFYIAAFAPGQRRIRKDPDREFGAGRSRRRPILPPQNGFLFLDRAKFAHSFAADVAPAEAAFMADSKVPWGVNALTGAVTEPAEPVGAKNLRRQVCLLYRCIS